MSKWGAVWVVHTDGKTRSHVAMPTAEELLVMQSHHSCRCRLDQVHLMTRAESRVSGS